MDLARIEELERLEKENAQLVTKCNQLEAEKMAVIGQEHRLGTMNEMLERRCHRLEESIRTTHTCTDHYCRACEYEIEKRHAEEELGDAK